ncbi:MAG TPA: peptide chain release factor N(5)-glutamine methyltransferase [Anaerolineales bacterium]|nr:peptide chain release factor N(5)-glutamine methyltransferase [Anaerolineales bacterium]
MPSSLSTLADVLPELADSLQAHTETPALDAQVLLAHLLGRPRTWIIAHHEAILTEEQKTSLAALAARLQTGEPLPYVLGHQEFYGLDFSLTPDVLIPRPETELLVERTAAWLRRHPTRRAALEVGTGSGCIAIALAVQIPDLALQATDISLAALDVARRNAHVHGVAGRITFSQADLFPVSAQGATAQPAFDILCANLPYIPTPTLHQLPIYGREPSLALDGGPDGLTLIRRLLDQASQQIRPEGLVILEIEASQGASVHQLAQAAFPKARTQILRDLAGKDRVIEVDMTESSPIVHLCERSAWQAAQPQGQYRPAAFAQEGFIHCSRPDQVVAVANRYYHGMQNMVLLWIDPQRLEAALRWEESGHGVFPHIYGPLNTGAVTAVTDFSPDADGTFRTYQLPG